MPVFAFVEVDRLHFDSHNPRFPTTVDGTDTAAVLRFMLSDANLIDLMRSIASQGFFPGEPLLVSPQPEAEGDWLVIEGNRRLAASILLHRPESAPIRIEAVRTVASESEPPRTIPCLQFETRAEILQHLGYRHVTGIKEWDPLAKARFLMQRYEEFPGTQSERFRELARSIGSRKDYVGRLLTALAIFRSIEDHSYWGIEDLDEESLNFSLLTSLLAYQNLVRYLEMSSAQSLDLDGLNEDALRWLTRWVFERRDGGRTVLGESRNLRLLAEVVIHPRALAALQDGQTLALAAKIGGAATGSFQEAVGTAKEHVSLAHNLVEGLDEVTSSDTSAVTNLILETRDLRRALEQRADEVS